LLFNKLHTSPNIKPKIPLIECEKKPNPSSGKGKVNLQKKKIQAKYESK